MQRTFVQPLGEVGKWRPEGRPRSMGLPWVYTVFRELGVGGIVFGFGFVYWQHLKV